jgi:hypothetical protein
MLSCMQTTLIQITEIKAADYNPRVMPEKEMEDLIRSIKEFGFIEPIVVNKRNMTVISGHQRLNAAMRMGMKEVPGIYLNLDPSKEKALNVAMNKIGGFFDDHLLADVLKDISDEDRPLSGYDDEEFNGLIDKLSKEAAGSSEVSFEATEGELDQECPRCKFKFAAQ